MPREGEKDVEREIEEEKMVQYSPKGGQKEALWNGLSR